MKSKWKYQMLELTSFKSTKRRIPDLWKRSSWEAGSVSRRGEYLYCVDVLRENAEQAMDIMADSVMHPSFSEEEVEESTSRLLMIDEMPSDMLSRDAAQMAAYVGHLGAAHLPARRNRQNFCGHIAAIPPKVFCMNCYLAAAGIDHDLFVKLAKDV